jgi:hypothetical protein
MMGPGTDCFLVIPCPSGHCVCFKYILSGRKSLGNWVILSLWHNSIQYKFTELHVKCQTVGI